MRNKPCPHCGTTTGQHKADCLLVRQFCGEVATPTPSPAPSASPHQGADALREALAWLVTLEDERIRLQHLHAMGHGTDYNHYHKTLPLAWATARAALAHHQAPRQGEQHGK